ncbi:hypothetical protein Mevan_0268 [Methanococcus vannielii SB]|uniref:Uncharacterized protein n=1 Tax=Methanococcus vannielii (strain ATCC 35089 / DSM 1224 / JCM 13029 / OCM 148 / SB) TaxID=406327 RepID=A6UNV5_METVS|nr:hypothetical protein [Methanococcus vannielii]ABR54177.1 hypothetical protein Mevan_0268 [Methanococcus vannielii SB]
MKITTKLTMPSIVATSLSHKGLCGMKYSEIRKQVNSNYRSVGAKYFEELNAHNLTTMYWLAGALYDAEDYNFKGDRYHINVIGNNFVRRTCMDIASVELNLKRNIEPKYEKMLKNIVESSDKFDFITQQLYLP